MKQSKEEHRFIDHGKHRISHIPFWSLLYRQPCSVVHSIIHIPFHEYLKTNKKNKKSRRNASNCSTYFLQASSTHEQLHEWNVKLSMSASASEEIDGGSNASDWHSEWHHCFWCQSAVDRAFSWTMSASSFQQKSAKVEVNVWWESFLSCVRMPLLAGNWQHHHEFLQWYLHTSDWVNSFQEINRHRQQSTMSRSRISEAKVAIFLFLAVSKSSHQSLEAICTPFVVDDLSELHLHQSHCDAESANRVTMRIVKRVSWIQTVNAQKYVNCLCACNWTLRRFISATRVRALHLHIASDIRSSSRNRKTETFKSQVFLRILVSIPHETYKNLRSCTKLPGRRLAGEPHELATLGVKRTLANWTTQCGYKIWSRMQNPPSQTTLKINRHQETSAIW